ncbi:MAG: NfeD family protein [Candidatus Cryptobacteroides sp.]
MGLIITLILVGLLLLFAEVVLIPGVGVAGILGLCSIIGSCVYAFLEIGQNAGIVTVVINILLITVMTVFMLRAKTWRRLSLDTNIDSKAQPDVESELAVGDTGKTVTRLSPMGKAVFGNVSVEVKALEGMIDSGTEVEVVMIEDNKVYVKPVERDF